MTLRSKKIITWILALSGLYVGVWAGFLPSRFFESFPGFGRMWVRVEGMGPYNEHLVRDVGGLYLALGIMSIWVAVAVRQDLFTLIGLGWLVFNVQHCLFHLHHIEVYRGLDYWANIATLVGVLVLSALLMTPPSPPRRGRTPIEGVNR
jgi:hypothetical protein